MEIFAVESSLIVWVDYEPWGEKLWTTFEKELQPEKYFGLEVARSYKKSEFQEYLKENAEMIKERVFFLVIYNTHTLDKVKDELEEIAGLTNYVRKRYSKAKQVLFHKEKQNIPSEIDSGVGRVKQLFELFNWIEEAVSGKKGTRTSDRPKEKKKKEKKVKKEKEKEPGPRESMVSDLMNRSSSVLTSAVSNAGSTFSKLGSQVTSSVSTVSTSVSQVTSAIPLSLPGIQQSARRSTISEKVMSETQKMDPVALSTMSFMAPNPYGTVKLSQKAPKFMSVEESLRALGCLKRPEILERQDLGIAILPGEVAMLTVQIYGARDLLLLDNTSIDPYVQVEYISRIFPTFKQKTKVVSNSRKPEWNESFDIFIQENPQAVKLTIYTSTLLGVSDQPLAALHIDINTDLLIRSERWLPLEKVSYVHPDPGEINLCLHLKVLGTLISLAPVFPNMDEALRKHAKFMQEEEEKKNKEVRTMEEFPEIISIFTCRTLPHNDLSELEFQKRMAGDLPLIAKGEVGILYLQVHGSRALPTMTAGPVHVQIIVQSTVLGTKKVKTRAISGTTAPKWDQKFVFAITDDVQSVSFQVIEQKLGSYEQIGELDIPMNPAMLEGFEGLFTASHERTDLGPPGLIDLGLQLFIEKEFIQEQLKRYLKLKLPEMAPRLDTSLIPMQKPKAKKGELSEEQLQQRATKNLVLYPTEVAEISITVVEIKSLLFPETNELKRPKIPGIEDETPKDPFDAYVSLETYAFSFGDIFYKTPVKHSPTRDLVWKTKFKFNIDHSTDHITFLVINTTADGEAVLGHVNLNLKPSMLNGVDEWYAIKMNVDPSLPHKQLPPNQRPRLHLKINISHETRKSVNPIEDVLARLNSTTRLSRENTNLALPRHKRGDWGKLLEGISVDCQVAAVVDEKRKLEIFSGDFKDSLSDLKLDRPRLIRIFFASPHVDTTGELTELTRDIIPYLQKLCSKFDYQLQLVTPFDSLAAEHLESEIAFQQLQLSQKLSAGPSLLTIFSKKFGPVGIFRQIPQDEFQELVTAIKTKGDESTFVSQYQLDPISQQYLLKKKTSSHSDLYFEVCQGFLEGWDEVLKSIAPSLAQNEKLKKYVSPEFYRLLEKGFLNAPKEVVGQTFAYRRDITKFEGAPDLKKLYFESEPSLVAQLETLKHSLPDKFKDHSIEGHIQDYKIECDQESLKSSSSATNPSFLKALSSSLDSFSDLCISQLTFELISTLQKQVLLKKDETFLSASRHHLVWRELIDKLSPKSEEERTFWSEEIREKESDLGRVVQYVQDQSEKSSPLFVRGTYGPSNSNFMAIAAKRVKERIPDSHLIVRFVGRTIDSKNYVEVLRDLIFVMGRLFPEKQVVEIPAHFENTALLFKNLLSSLKHLTQTTPLIIFIDGIDTLHQAKKEAYAELNWLPSILPSRIKLIISLETDQKYFSHLKTVFDNSSFINLDPPLATNSFDILREYLLLSKKVQVTGELSEVLKQKVPEKHSPVWMILAANHIAPIWRAHVPIRSLVLPPTINDLIGTIFRDLEKVHGQTLVRHAVAHISCSRYGLSDIEIEDLFSVDDPLLDDIYRFTYPPVRRIPPLFWKRLNFEIQDLLSFRIFSNQPLFSWFSPAIEKSFQTLYLHDKKFKKEIHELQGNYFGDKYYRGKPFYNKETMRNVLVDRLLTPQPFFTDNGGSPLFNVRRLSEWPYHLAYSDQPTILFQLLTSPKFLYGCFKNFLGDAFLEVFNFCDLTEYSQQVKLIEVLRDKSPLYNCYPHKIIEPGWIKVIMGEVAKKSLNQMKGALGSGLMTMFESSQNFNSNTFTNDDEETNEDFLETTEQEEKEQKVFQDVILNVNKLSTEKQTMIVRTFIQSMKSEERVKVLLPFVWDLGPEGREKCLKFLSDSVADYDASNDFREEDEAE